MSLPKTQKEIDEINRQRLQDAIKGLTFIYCPYIPMQIMRF